MSKSVRKSSWNGMCPAGKHGADYEGQPCDLCAKQKREDQFKALCELKSLLVAKGVRAALALGEDRVAILDNKVALAVLDLACQQAGIRLDVELVLHRGNWFIQFKE